MIRYVLACDQGHGFESWFPNSAAYDKQAKRGLVACPHCGSVKVEKAIMSPRLVGTKHGGDASAISNDARLPAAEEKATSVAMLSPQEQSLRQKLKEIRDHLTKNADYVGKQFPEQARKMHYGDIEHRSIYGEASQRDAKELQDEGIEFHPLPILPDEQN